MADCREKGGCQYQNSEKGFQRGDASLKLNGVEEGMKAYDGVVKLLLDYYDGVLYGDVLVTVDAE